LPEGSLGEVVRPGPLHRLEHPRLTDSAARAFFAGAEARFPETRTEAASRLAAKRSLWGRHRRSLGGRVPDAQRLELLRETCRYRPAQCSTLFAEWLFEAPDSPALAQALANARTNELLRSVLDPELLARLATWFDAEPSEREEREERDDERASFRHHGAPFHPLRPAPRHAAAF
jgi:hypothetical protein